MNTDSLEQYLAGDYVRDKKDISDIDSLLEDIARTLSSSFDGTLGWPYQLDQNDGPKYPKKDDGPSTSTTSMILLALLRLLGRARWDKRWQKGKVRQFPVPDLDRELAKEIDRHCKLALNLLFPPKNKPAKGEAGASEKDSVVQPDLSKSGTWGTNDPLTAAWMLEVTRADDWDKTAETQLAAIKDAMLRAFDWPARPADTREIRRWQKPNATVLDHVFFDLRFLYLAEALEPNPSAKEAYRQKIESKLHDQLSFISIPDSRFDPAELAFCLEGMLLIQPDSVDRGLFERVVAVLTEAQEQNAHWRPVKPLIATAQGFVIFPISVEVANSLLRSCTIMGAERIHENFDGLTLPRFRRYWEWLRARMVRSVYKGQKYVGWHSEHVNQPGLIHMWETSQVIEFMLGYRRLLQDHIARRTLVLSRFNEKKPPVPKAALALIVKRQQDSGSANVRWDAIAETFEPVVNLGGYYSIYERIADDFIKGHAAGKPENYSMLLYGPPGTGKTTIAENIAAALGYPLITITVSDFLAGGEAEIEGRAKSIFNVLEAQSEAVVLFDEIDNFLLDRNTRLYRKQDTLYQFMTPGMLTKLNDLRRSKRVVFIIATNYGHRIDAAIKRPGRIDRQYLVLPPDQAGRLRIIDELARERFGGAVEGVKNDQALAKAALYMGFADLKVVVDRVSKAVKPENRLDELRSQVNAVSATTSIASYDGQFTESSPYEELLCLAALALEVDDTGWTDVVARALEKKGKTSADIDQLAGRIPKALRDKIVGHLGEPSSTKAGE